MHNAWPDPFFALTYCITGRVTENGVPVAGANLQLYKESIPNLIHLALTDQDGYYRFCDLSNGNYYVTCFYYQSVSPMPVRVLNNDLNDIDFNTRFLPPYPESAPVEKTTAPGVESKAGDNRLQSNTETSAISPQPSALATGTPESTGAVRYYIWDHLGTTRVVTDGNGNLISTHDYEPFGVEIPPLGGTGDITDLPSPNSHKFTGHERDQSTGYDYMHARFYGSSIARFLRPDPLDLGTQISRALPNPQAWNLYAYVNGNPVNFNDPSGMLGPMTDWNTMLPKEPPPTTTDPLPGTETGEEIVEGCADIITDPESTTSEKIGATVAGTVASMWTPETAEATILNFTLLATTAYFGPAIDAALETTAAGIEAATVGSARAVGTPGFAVTPGGEAIAIPKGALGPISVRSGKGFMFEGGSGGPGLNSQVSGVRIMDPTMPTVSSPGYPGGYVNYMNSSGQAVNPYTGQTISKLDPLWHIPIKPGS